MVRSLASCAALGLAAGLAQAAFFSFPSDTADRAWTFTGNDGFIDQAVGPNDPLVLFIDDNNGILPRLEVSVRFEAHFNLRHVGSIPLGGGAFSHNYLSSGVFSFRDVAAGVVLLGVEFQNGLFTARGGENSWFTTGALQVDHGAGASVNMTWGGAELPGYGLMPGPLNGLPRGFAFDLTALNHDGRIPWGGQLPGVPLNPNNKQPAQRWWSESSFSATAFVPAPGTLAVLGLAGLATARRRRTA